MAKKGIAVPYIIALILGIVVVGVIGYWFFTTTGAGSGSAVVQQCNAKKTQYCSEWSRVGFASGREPSGGDWDVFAPGCSTAGVGKPIDLECRTLTGLLKAKGAECSIDLECQSLSCAANTCPAGFNPEGKQCAKETITNPTCPTGATLNAQTDKCEVAGAASTDPTCTRPSTYITRDDKCHATETANPTKSVCS